MQVSDIMTRGVIAVAPETPVGEVARALVSHNVSGVPVVEAERVVGVVTEHDLIARQHTPDLPLILAFFGGFIYFGEARYEEEMRHVLATTAAQLMTAPAQTIREDATVEELATLMYERKVNPVPVVDAQDRLVGIVSRSDLIRLMIREGG